MFIMTANGWRPLWTLSAPKLEPIPWDAYGQGWKFDSIQEQEKMRRDFEASELAKLVELRQQRSDIGLI